MAVVEERDLPALLRLIHTSTGSEGSSASNIPQSVITLPAPTSLPFAPAPINPLSMYYPPSELQFMPAWNPSGLNLTDLALPCGVFLAPEDLADEYREHAQQNNRRVRAVPPSLPGRHSRPEHILNCQRSITRYTDTRGPHAAEQAAAMPARLPAHSASSAEHGSVHCLSAAVHHWPHSLICHTTSPRVCSATRNG